VSDPLSDPRASDLLGASCEEILGVQHMFATVATQANDAVGVMDRIAGTPTWCGKAADAARSSMAKLSPQLKTIGEGYTQAAKALGDYYDTVSSVQPQFKTLKTQLESAAASVHTLSTSYTGQTTGLARMTNLGLLPTSSGGTTFGSAFTTPAQAKTNAATVKQDQANIAAAKSQLTTAQGHLTTLQAQGMRLLQSFSDARDTVTTKVHAAYSHAPQESGWHKFLGGVEHVVDDGVGFVVGLAKGVYDDAVALPSDVAAVWDHPGDAAAWEKFGEDAAVVVGTVALVAGVVVTGGTALGAEGAVMGGIETTADVLGTTSKVVQGVHIATEVNDGNYKGAVIDTAFANIPDASNELDIGDDAVTTTEAGVTGSETYATALSDDGATPASAYAGLTDKARAGLDGTGQVPLNSTAADNLVTAQKAAAKVANRNYNLYGRNLDNVVDKTVKEPTDKKIKVLVGAGPGDHPEAE
jgi:hypothetical protein